MSRRSTVYDYSSLSLHPDGSCTGESSRLWRPQAHVDTRGNLVAPPPKFIFYTKAKSIVDDENQGEEFDLSDVESTPTTSRKGKQKERTPEADGRARGAKRRKVVHDFGFLETSVPQTTTASSSTSSFAVPSSDLLKSIHHFACNYYSDRGQLFNDSRAYRKAKKQRRLAKLAMKQKVQAGEIDSGEEDPDTSPTKPDKTRRRDMYKTLDGSALLAVGVCYYRSTLLG
ncbi:hypothetical protein C8R43DRAFT_436985 [Mycena crocata]|nr:hypothetical protein C8R43DRAFT_436985 [Mycena crocata]